MLFLTLVTSQLEIFNRRDVIPWYLYSHMMLTVCYLFKHKKPRFENQSYKFDTMPPVAKPTTSCLSDKTQSIVRRSFHWFGRRVHSHSLWFLSIGILLILAFCGCGALYNSRICVHDATRCYESRSTHLFVPRQSFLWSQYTEIEDTFGTKPSALTMMLTAPDDESILTPSRLNAAFEVIDTINNLTLQDHNARDYEYTDLCTRSSPTQPHCDSSEDNFFAVLFQNDESLWNEMNATLSIVNSPGAPTALYLGGLRYGEGDDPVMITSAQSLRITYSLKGSGDKTVNGNVCSYTLRQRRHTMSS